MKRINKHSILLEEDGKKFLLLEGSGNKTDVQTGKHFSLDELTIHSKKLFDEDYHAFVLFSDALACVQNSDKLDDCVFNHTTRYNIDINEERLLEKERRLDKLSEAYAIVEENKQAANVYVKEMNYNQHLTTFLDGVDNGESRTELIKEFDRFYDGSYTDEDIKWMIKMFNAKGDFNENG